MKITINKTTSTIFAENIRKDKIKDITDSIEAIKGCEITVIKYGFILGVVLTDYQKAKFSKTFRKIDSKKGIITGFRGCAITGLGFEWL